MKAPLEAPAETLGSVINQHGRKQRCSLAPASLSSEVQVAWNGPFEFSKATDKLLEEALDRYFEEHTQQGSARFYVSSKLRFASSTISKFMNLSNQE